MLSEESPMKMVTWRCTRRCSGSCTYCSYPKSFDATEANTKLAYKIVDEIYDFGSPLFGISGGEPLLRNDIFDVISHAKKIGLGVSLITSGFVFDEKRFNNLVRNEVYTAISIDGNRESNDLIRGRGSYDKAIHAAEKLSEAGLLDCLVTTMTRYNFKELDHTLELAEKFGARMIVYHNLVPVGRAGSNMNSLALSPDEYEWALNHIYDLERGHKGKTKFNVYSPFYARIVRQRSPTGFWDWFTKEFLGRCTIGGEYVSITENADYRSCGFNEEYRLGNVADKTLKATWDELQRSELHLKLRDRNNLKGKCGICEYREICGGCRTRAEHYSGDLFESDPACAYIPKLLREK